MPNEGNVCAYPGCTLGRAIAEGAPARYALADPTKWCHKECADRWERFGAEQTPEPVIDVDPILCGAPHPELHDFTCSKAQHPGDNYHHSGAGHSWYMEPGQVASLQDAIAKRNQVDTNLAAMTEADNRGDKVAGDQAFMAAAYAIVEPAVHAPGDAVEATVAEYTGPSGRNTAEPDIKISVEDPSGEVLDTHKCCKHCGPSGHAPHTAGCPADLPSWELGENIADEADTRPPAEGSYAAARMQADSENDALAQAIQNKAVEIDAKLKEASDGAVGFEFGEFVTGQREGTPFLVQHDANDLGITNVSSTPPTDPVVADTLAIVNIFRSWGVQIHPGLINDLISWKRG